MDHVQLVKMVVVNVLMLILVSHVNLTYSFKMELALNHVRIALMEITDSVTPVNKHVGNAMAEPQINVQLVI